MPSMNKSRMPLDPERYEPLPAPTTPPTMQHPMPPTAIARSPVMLASLPGMGSGPDAVLRQFNGGRQVPTQRILVP